jgi:hypothetical protein
MFNIVILYKNNLFFFYNHKWHLFILLQEMKVRWDSISFFEDFIDLKTT